MPKIKGAVVRNLVPRHGAFYLKYVLFTSLNAGHYAAAKQNCSASSAAAEIRAAYFEFIDGPCKLCLHREVLLAAKLLQHCLPCVGGFALGALFVNLVGTENGIGKHENVVVLNLHYPRRYRRLLLLLAGNAEGEFAGDERRYGVAVPRHYAVLPVYGGNDEALALALVKGTVGT